MVNLENSLPQQTNEEIIVVQPNESNINVSQTNQQKENENIASSKTGSAKIPGRDNERKIFIGGLNKQTTEDDLRAYFTQFGVIESAIIKIDPQTMNSRGYAFVVFSSAEAVAKVTEANNHVIKNKKIDVQIPKTKTGKIYVGKITAELTKEDISDYFGQFGKVIDVEMPFDHNKNERKNFCFVVFSSEKIAQELLKTSSVRIKNVKVDVKKAISKSDPSLKVPAQNYNQMPTFGQQDWSANQMSGGFVYGQPAYGNGYYSLGYGGVPAYNGYNGYTSFVNNNAIAPNITNNNANFSPQTGRDKAYNGYGFPNSNAVAVNTTYNNTSFTPATGRGNARGSGDRGRGRRSNRGRGNGACSVEENIRHKPY